MAGFLTTPTWGLRASPTRCPEDTDRSAVTSERPQPLGSGRYCTNRIPSRVRPYRQRTKPLTIASEIERNVATFPRRGSRTLVHPWYELVEGEAEPVHLRLHEVREQVSVASLGDLRLAIEAYATSLQLRPDQPWVMANLIRAYRASGKADAAASLLATLRSISPLEAAKLDEESKRRR